MQEKDYRAILSSIDDAIAVLERQGIRSPSDKKVYEALTALRKSVSETQGDVVSRAPEQPDSSTRKRDGRHRDSDGDNRD